jgi:hypothetical protein
VERNRLKRLLREAFAAEAPDLGPEQDFVVVARADLRERAEREGLSGVRSALHELIDRAGARDPATDGQQVRPADDAPAVPGKPADDAPAVPGEPEARQA